MLLAIDSDFLSCLFSNNFSFPKITKNYSASDSDYRMSHNYKIINAQCTLNWKIWVNKEIFLDYLLSLLECWTLTYIFSFYMYSKYTFSSMHYESSTLTVELWFFGTMLYTKKIIQQSWFEKIYFIAILFAQLKYFTKCE